MLTAIAAVTFILEAGPASERLNLFGHLTHVGVIYSVEAMRGYQTHRLECADCTVIEAMVELLWDTGLTATYTKGLDEQYFTVEPEPPDPTPPDIQVPRAIWRTDVTHSGGSMDLQAVTSSNIKAAGFADGKMRIQFANGTLYEYSGPKVEEHYKNFMAADSKGAYFAKSIRSCPHTTFARVTEDVAADGRAQSQGG